MFQSNGTEGVNGVIKPSMVEFGSSKEHGRLKHVQGWLNERKIEQRLFVQKQPDTEGVNGGIKEVAKLVISCLLPFCKS